MLSTFCIFLIRIYQRILSPLLQRSCRFTPSCSEYTIGVIRKFGVLKGIKLGGIRLAKCHPWGPHGYDPIP